MSSHGRGRWFYYARSLGNLILSSHTLKPANTETSKSSCCRKDHLCTTYDKKCHLLSPHYVFWFSSDWWWKYDFCTENIYFKTKLLLQCDPFVSEFHFCHLPKIFISVLPIIAGIGKDEVHPGNLLSELVWGLLAVTKHMYICMYF